MDDTLESVDTPNCPECLVRLIAGGTEEHPYWFCPQCQVARLS